MKLVQFLEVGGSIEGPGGGMLGLRKQDRVEQYGPEQRALPSDEAALQGNPEFRRTFSSVREAVESWQDIEGEMQTEFSFTPGTISTGLMQGHEAGSSGEGDKAENSKPSLQPNDVPVYSRISPSRVKVIRNDLLDTDLELRFKDWEKVGSGWSRQWIRRAVDALVGFREWLTAAIRRFSHTE